MSPEVVNFQAFYTCSTFRSHLEMATAILFGDHQLPRNSINGIKGVKVIAVPLDLLGGGEPMVLPLKCSATTMVANGVWCLDSGP